MKTKKKPKIGGTVIMHLLFHKASGPIKSRRIVGADKTVICSGGSYVVACDPLKRRLDRDFRASASHFVVTCPKCRQSKEYKRMAEAVKSVSLSAGHVSTSALKALAGGR